MRLLALVLLLPLLAFAAPQSDPGLYYGQVPSAAQWNSYFDYKLDYNPAGLAVNLGGTGATTVSGAQASLGIVPNLSATSTSIGGSPLAAGATATGTVAIAGATTSMGVVVTPSAYPGAGIVWSGYVSAAGTVTVVVTAVVAATPAATTYNVRVIQ